jgi:hypothetical protein
MKSNFKDVPPFTEDPENDPKVEQEPEPKSGTDYSALDIAFPEPMGADAFHGIFGRVIDIIEPVSEATREAILAQLIVAVGNMMGRSVFRYQGGRHHLNEFTVIVGKTGRGRKGTSWNAVQNLLECIEGEWLSKRVLNGIQSGEAIIYNVRDERHGIDPKAKQEPGEPPTLTLLDEGIKDKRLLMLEEEFARLLQVAGRQNSSHLRTCVKPGMASSTCTTTASTLQTRQLTHTSV